MRFVSLGVLITSTIILSACSHRIVRSGFEKSSADPGYCEVSFKQEIQLPDSIATSLGFIELKDGGFSTNCNENTALGILRQEACALGADLVVIRDVRFPDALSSCYRCTAEFYRFHDLADRYKYRTDPFYDSYKVSERVRLSRNQTTGLIVGSILGAVIGAVLIGLIY